MQRHCCTALLTCIESERLDVVKVLDDTLKGATAIIGQIGARLIPTCLRKSICEELVYRAAAPFCGRCALDAVQ